MRFLRFLRSLKGFWPLSLMLWLAGLICCVLLVPLLTPERELVFIAMALVSACWLLAVVLRQYKRIRAERNIENLVELEVHREAAATDSGDYQILNERLKHALAMQRAARSVDGGKASLYELPWYLVIGMAASGKTSLLTRSSLSATVAGGNNVSGVSGTQHCDWYFSREAVMIDTAGRYLVEDRPAREFSNFLKTLRRQRKKPAINGLVLVVSLPELLQQSRQEMHALAEQLVARVDDYRRCLGGNPPLYLFFSKSDLLPGFTQTFETMSSAERQSPWGMTFSLDELQRQGVTSAFQHRFPGLVAALRDRVDQRVLDAGGDADSKLLRFPDYFSELFGVLSDFLEQFDSQQNAERAPVLRGLYFTSALQSGDTLPALLDEQTREDFALASSAVATSGNKAADKNYFITDTFRKVIFPDRNLGLYYSQNGAQRSLPGFMIGTMGLLAVAVICAQGWSAFNNRQWLDQIHDSVVLLDFRDGDRQLSVAERGKVLDELQRQLTEIESDLEYGAPLDRALGLYQGSSLREPLKQAWEELFKQQVLTPVAAHLAYQLSSWGEFNGAVPELANLTQITEPESLESADSKVMSVEELGAPADEIGANSLDRMQERATITPTVGGVPTSFAEVGSRLRSEARSRTTDNARDAWYSARSEAESLFEEDLRDRSLQMNGDDLGNTTEADAGRRLSGEQGPSLSEELLTKLSREEVEKLIESYSSLKLYLVLTAPGLHSDQDDFVASALPRLWAAVGGSRGGALVDDSVVDNTALYTYYLNRGMAPALEQNERLVSHSRDRLNSFLIDSTLVDREYLRYQLEVEELYEPLTLSRMLPGMRGRLLYSSRAVPAFYTREVWEDYLRSAIIETASGDLRDDTDWVLDEADVDDAVEVKARFVRQLMARYKRDYAIAWERFLANTYVGDFDTLDQASARLALLSDLQDSPLRQVLEVARANTTWDDPEPQDESDGSAGESGEQGFWRRVTSVFDAGDAAAMGQSLASLPKINDGALTNHFRPITRMLSADTSTAGGDSVLNQYLLNLRQLKVRIDNVRGSRDIGNSSKALIVETLSGEPNEINTLRNFVASRIDTSQTSLVSALEPLFSVPVSHTREALQGPARQRLNAAWDEKIVKPWGQMVAGRYPVTDSVNEASVRDMEYFIDPDSGVMPRFRREDIGDLVAGDNEQSSPMVDRRMLASIDTATALGSVIDSLSDLRNGFEIQMNPTAGLTDIILTIDGQRLHYRNNSQSWERLTWPGNGDLFGARLDVINSDGRRHTVFDYPNRWGFLRMIESARITPIDNARQQFSWQTPLGAVSFDVRNFGGVKVSDLQSVKSLRLPVMGEY
ncbi:type VI secretion protein IcmF/TssM N-terminal domain-containing protein [Marinobacterium lutimaris]|uniref:Type VI secretion system protein ImpL n=1 Tax=Marinobacterium lutimaris TaxID=568106 RepID=A0A1H5UEC0_9GAMM|nr:type VI secretion protein IcmF/TssM N-terminal domain-containing protein [Marinobacterium lutimaris]SEF73423.1 type VI secretion system protein ImpL [Marinobacterium lutimaris]